VTLSELRSLPTRFHAKDCRGGYNVMVAAGVVNPLSVTMQLCVRVYVQTRDSKWQQLSDDYELPVDMLRDIEELSWLTDYGVGGSRVRLDWPTARALAVWLADLELECGS